MRISEISTKTISTLKDIFEMDDEELFQLIFNTDADNTEVSKEIRVESVSSFRRGQHISMPGQKFRIYDRYSHKLLYLYKHHAIIKEIRRTAGTRIEMELIHFTKEKQLWKPKICESLVTFDLVHDELYIVEYIQPGCKADNTVHQAESMLPENNKSKNEFGYYNPCTNNCEHLAAWCVVGKRISGQGKHLQAIFTELWSGIQKWMIQIAETKKNFITPKTMLLGIVVFELVYRTFMTVSHFRNGHLSKRKLYELWKKPIVLITTSVAQFLFLTLKCESVQSLLGGRQKDKLENIICRNFIHSEPIMLRGVVFFGFIYCILKTVSHVIDCLNGNNSKTCLKENIKDLWKTYTMFVLSYLVENAFSKYMYIPLISAGPAAIAVEALILMSFRWYIVPKIRKYFQSPFIEANNTVKAISEIKIGDVIFLKHAVIVTEGVDSDPVDSSSVRIRGVHYGLQSFGKYEVTEEYFPIDRHSKVKVLDDTKMVKNTPEETVMRARKRIGEKKWALFSNCSDHLCFWAKVQQKPREMSETLDNGDLKDSQTKELSSLALEKEEVHLVDNIVLGDVIKFKKRGIVVGIKNVKREGRQFEIEMIVYNWGWRWYCRNETFEVDLNKDNIVIEHFHKAHCRPKNERVDHANSWKDERGIWWTNNGFIYHCIKR